ncbi:MAG: S9 family peptidase [Acidobacteriia bacterium]|nr:S9 family peptidase [Terriglobia bacterium]
MNKNIRSTQFRIFLAACCLAAAICARAQSGTPALRKFQQVAISPDGNRVAWVGDAFNASGGLDGSAIYVQDLKAPDAKPRRITAARGGMSASEDTIAWSPDSRQLAFLSDVEGHDQSQLYVAHVDGGTARKLTTLTGSLADPAWSSDGKTLAFLFTENAPRANPLMPMAAETGVIDAKVYAQRLTLVDLASGKIRQLSPPDMYVYEYDWAPDGKSFAAIAAHGAGDANWYVAQVYTLGAESGELRPVYKPKLQIATPRWSPDGKSIAFIEGLMSDEGFTGGDIYVVPANGGDTRNVTPGIAASPSGIHWRTDGEILFTENVDGQVGVSTVGGSDGKISPVWSGSGVMTNSFWGGTSISLAADGRSSAAIRHSWKNPPEIWAGPVGEWRQITHANQALHPGWGDMQSLHWTSDGMSIQGWLIYPKDYDPSRRYPMVVVVHGGPAIAGRTGWPEQFFNTYELSAHGYFVLNPNPRGSLGRGEKFTQANVKDFGYGDFRDILAGVDEVVKTFPVDSNRIGITGWSYGGYMTMWAVTQTNRFRAAVAGAGLSNWQSYYGQNDIDEWMIPYFGTTVYDDPAVYAKSAPMNFIKNVKTPTLVVVGERDGECPAPQSREFWHALQTLGVETQLVIYAGEGHVFNQPEHQRDVMERTIAWFDRYLKSN